MDWIPGRFLLYTSWQASVVCFWNFLIRGTGFDLLLELLLAKIVPYFSSFLLIVQQTEWRWCEVIWECVPGGWHWDVLCSSRLGCVSQLSSFQEVFTPLPSTHPQGNTDWSWAREQSKLPQGSCWSKIIASYRSVLWIKSENEGLHWSSGIASRKVAA